MKIDKLIKIIKQNMNKNTSSPYIIAIDGMSASGKTTLSLCLQKYFPKSNIFHMDDYFLRPEQRTNKRLSEIGGNVDYERFQDEILLHLQDKNGLSYHKYNCHTQTLEPATHVDWKPLVIIEGCYSQHPYFGQPYNLRIFCEISKDEQIERISKRNGSEMLTRFLEEWIPKENDYFEHYKIKNQSGLLM